MRSNVTVYPSYKVKLGSSILKGPETLLLILEVWDVNATYSKSYPTNLLMWSNLTFDPSFKVKLWSSILKGPKSLRWIHSCISVEMSAVAYFELSYYIPAIVQ